MKNKIIIILVLLVTFIFLFTGCFGKKIGDKIGEKISENVTEKIMEAASENDVDVDISKNGISIESEDGKFVLTGGDDAKWPEDAPKSIPEWNEPLISSVVTGNSLMVGSQDIALKQFEDYVEKIEKAGFEEISSIKASGVYMLQYKLDDVKLTVSYTEESKDLTIIADWE